MSKSNSSPTPRRTSVERNVYRRSDGRFELGYRDSTGKQRWQVIDGGIMAARAERDAILGDKGKGKRVQPNPRLRFGEAADRWLAEQVAMLRPTTQASYANSVETHLRLRWGRRRMDSIDVDDAAKLVRELRAAGKSEWTISTILRAASRVFTFARRRCSWHGDNPISLLENGERPKVSQTQRRRIFNRDELTQTIAKAGAPFKLLFMLAAITGARESELLGIVWQDVDLSNPDDASISFEYQVDRQGQRQVLKTDESQRTVEIPREIASLLLLHRASSPHSTESAFVFATRTGRAISQRNVLRELRRAMSKATDEKGRPTFPALHLEDANGKPLPVERGSVPCFHGFRHTAASEAIAAGDGAEEVSWMLGHRNSNVTRSVYVQEIRSSERSARRRERLAARYGTLLHAAAGQEAGSHHSAADVVPLRDNPHRA